MAVKRAAQRLQAAREKTASAVAEQRQAQAAAGGAGAPVDPDPVRARRVKVLAATLTDIRHHISGISEEVAGAYRIAITMRCYYHRISDVGIYIRGTS